MGEKRSSSDARRGYRRRTALAAIATALGGGIAGCTSSGDDSPADGSGDTTRSGTGGHGTGDAEDTTMVVETTEEAASNVFESVRFEGRTLKATLSNPDGVAKVNLVNDGEVWASESVQAGGDTVSLLAAEETVRDVTLDIVAVGEDGDPVDTVTKTFSADPVVSRIRSGAVREGITDVSAEEVEANWEQFTEAYVTIENAGNAPAVFPTDDFANVWITSGVPQPEELRDARVYELVAVGPGESVEIRHAGATPLRFDSPDGESVAESWPAEVREMGESFPDDFADGDTLEAEVVFRDASKNEYSDSIEITYSGGLVHTRDDLTSGDSYFVAREVTSE